MYRDPNTANSAITVAEIMEENEKYFQAIKDEKRQQLNSNNNLEALLQTERKQNEYFLKIIDNQNKIYEAKDKETKKSKIINYIMVGISAASLIATILIAILK